MKTTRINIITVATTALILLLAIPTFANYLVQKKPLSLDSRLQTMTQRLSLTSEQVTKIRPLLEAQDKEMKNIRLANTSNHRVQRKEVKARQAAEKEINRQADRDNHATMNKAIAVSDSTFEKGIAAVLTAEQHKKFVDEQKKK
ncbi:MAG: Spy/CpxP family protein refolding chaperone [Candidatus Kapabacteria bacterium]|nr:Spy/CpxP family protein refolding chaperone [Candidatus Kapabacteria bacterium]